MLFKKIITVYTEIHMEPINTLCGHNAELLIVKTGGTWIPSPPFPTLLLSSSQLLQPSSSFFFKFNNVTINDVTFMIL
jgi:hypothetical protein